MANKRTINSSDAVITLSAAGLFSGVQLQGFSTDDIADTDSSETVETQMGVDGQLSAGYTPAMVKVTFTLQANSPSIDLFEQIDAQQVSGRAPIQLSANYTFPGVGKTYSAVNGYLTSVPRMPSAGKVMKPRRFTVTWESVTPAAA